MAEEFERIQETLEGFMKKLSDKKTKKKYALIDDLKKFIFTNP